MTNATMSTVKLPSYIMKKTRNTRQSNTNSLASYICNVGLNHIEIVFLQ